MFTCCCEPSSVEVPTPLPKAHIAVPVAPKPVMLQLLSAPTAPPEVKPQSEVKPQVKPQVESESDEEAESESEAEEEDDSPDTCTDILTGLVAVNVLIFLGLTLYSMKLSIDSNFVPYNPTTSTSIEDLD